jgi:hypothetical protein
MPFHVGDKVYRKANPTHQGEVLAIRNSAVVKVRWKTVGWIECEIPLRDLEKVPTKNSIPVLKAMAVKANALGDTKLLETIIVQLDLCWDDDAAAQRFYTELEQTAPEKS